MKRKMQMNYYISRKCSPERTRKFRSKYYRKIVRNGREVDSMFLFREHEPYALDLLNQQVQHEHYRCQHRHQQKMFQP